MKRILWVFLAGMIFVATHAVYAEQATVAQSGTVTDIGNKICPVSGDKAGTKQQYVYNGKRYNFCCAGCVKKFKKNPAKYMAEPAKG